MKSSTALTTLERNELRDLENTIEKGIAAFWEAGQALAKIAASKLYREDYPNFNAYVAGRWDMRRSRAYQLIDGFRVMEDLKGVLSSTSCEQSVPLPTHESQTRALTRLDSPASRGEAWKHAVERSNGSQPTARVVETVVEDFEDVLDELEAELEGDSRARHLAMNEEVARRHAEREAKAAEEESVEGRLERGRERIRQARKLFEGAPVAAGKRKGVAVVVGFLEKAEKAAVGL